MKHTGHNTSRQKKGFSLVELLVATALFTIVVAVSAGSFLSILEASRQSRELNELMLAVDFAMEDMSRTIRTGSGFQILSGGTGIRFGDENGNIVTYQRSGGRIQKQTVGYNGPLTPESISIQRLIFSGDLGSSHQPRIIINVVGQLGSSANDRFYLQTSVTQRELNL